MTKMGWLVVTALAVGGTVYATRGCLSSTKSPDEELAGQFEDMCGIARKNVKNPVRGVKQLGRFMAKNTGEMLAHFGDTITLIERISDDDKHDDRARVARDRIWRPWFACAADWERFADAIDNSQEATEIMVTAMERLDRTLGIIFSGKQGGLGGRVAPHIDVRHLPALLLEQLPTGSRTSR